MTQCAASPGTWQKSDNGPTSRSVFDRLNEYLLCTPTWKLRPTPGRSTNGLTPAFRSFSGSPMDSQLEIECYISQNLTNAGSLQDQRRTKRATADYDKLASLVLP